MLRSEITSFNLICGEVERACTPPFSLCTAEGAELPSGSFSAVFTLAPSAQDFKYEYIRLTDLVGLTEVRLSGEVIHSTPFTGRVLNLNIKDKVKQGENTLELVFSQTAGSHLCAGLFGKAELLMFSGAVIDRVGVKQSFEGGFATLDISLDMLGSSDQVRAVATLVSTSGQIFYGGITRGRGNITVKDPLYWWPKDMGVQNLYKLTVNLYGELEIEDTVELKVGIRRLSVNDSRATVDIGGASFLPLGAVYRPERRTNVALSAKRELAFINSAARVGMNALLIKSDDRLPDEVFFELCDAHGICVIREIRSSVMESSADEAELLARICHHPSMVLYQIIYDSGNKNQLRERMGRIAPSVAVRFVDKAPVYPRFPELPSAAVTDKLLAEDEKNLFSEKMESLGRGVLIDMIGTASERYPYAGGFDDFAYISSVAAATLTGSEMIASRLARGDKHAIYDGLGDTEDGLCYSGIDSAAVWRATHYMAAKFFSPIYLHAEHIDDGRVVFYISNEKRQSFAGSIEYRIADSQNKTVHTGSEKCVIERLTSKLVLEKDFSHLLRGHENEYYLECFLRDPLGVYSQSTTLFVPEKHFKLRDPEISAQIVGSDRRFSITLSAKAFARAVEIGFKDVDAVFYDNYVDITGSAPMKIAFTLTGGMSTAEKLMSSLKIKSIYDVKK